MPPVENRCSSRHALRAHYSAAAQTVLDSEFGSGEIPTVTLSTANAPGLVRRYVRLSDIVEEVSSARIWCGIHWRADQEFGEDP